MKMFKEFETPAVIKTANAKAAAAWNTKTNQVYVYPFMQAVIGLGLLTSAAFIAIERLDASTNPFDFSEHHYLGGNDPIVAALIALAGTLLVVAAVSHKLKQRSEASYTHAKALDGLENVSMMSAGFTLGLLGAFGLVAGALEMASSNGFKNAADSMESGFALIGDSNADTQVTFMAAFAGIFALGLIMYGLNRVVFEPKATAAKSGDLNAKLLEDDIAPAGGTLVADEPASRTERVLKFFGQFSDETQGRIKEREKVAVGH